MSSQQYQEDMNKKMDVFSNLEKSLESLYERAETFKNNLESETKKSQKALDRQEKKKRKQMAESKSSEETEIPKGFYPRSMQRKIEKAQSETKQRASSGSFLKPLLV